MKKIFECEWCGKLIEEDKDVYHEYETVKGDIVVICEECGDTLTALLAEEVSCDEVEG